MQTNVDPTQDATILAQQAAAETGVADLADVDLDDTPPIWYKRISFGTARVILGDVDEKGEPAPAEGEATQIIKLRPIALKRLEEVQGASATDLKPLARCLSLAIREWTVVLLEDVDKPKAKPSSETDAEADVEATVDEPPEVLFKEGDVAPLLRELHDDDLRMAVVGAVDPRMITRVMEGLGFFLRE